MGGVRRSGAMGGFARRIAPHGQVVGDGPALRVERTMLALFVAMRVGMLVLEGPLLRDSGRRPTRATALAWGAVAASTAVIGWQGFPRPGRRGQATVVIDLAASATAMVIRSVDAPGAFDWTAGAAFWSAAAVGAPFERRLGQVVAVTPLALVYGLVRTRRPGGPVRQMRVAQDVVLLYVFALGIGEVIRRMRLAASEIEIETDRAVSDAEEATRLEEEFRARTELHEGSIRALTAIRDHWSEDRAAARRIAAAEARRVRAWIETDSRVAPDGRAAVLTALDLLADRLMERGVVVELITAELAEAVNGDAASAVLAALSDSLDRASECGDRFLVRVASDGGFLRATARSRSRRQFEWTRCVPDIVGGHAEVVGDRLELRFPV